jgi:serine/threonine-protein kinase RsbW
MAEPPNVTLTLSNTPQNVSLVRAVLGGVAEIAALGRNDLNDIRTAVTEACNNVALHAYVGARGPLEVDIHTQADGLGVTVRDRGIGFPSQPGAASEELGGLGGLGLQIMHALARRLELAAAASGGSEVRMQFAAPGARALARPQAARGRPDLQAPTTGAALEPHGAGTALQATIAPPQLAAGVLPRVLGALAAHAHFSTDRISDAQLLADALAAHADDGLVAERLDFAIDVEPRDLRLRIGPLEAGAAQRMLADTPTPSLPPVLERLADAHEVTSTGRHEVLSLRLLDRGRATPMRGKRGADRAQRDD